MNHEAARPGTRVSTVALLCAALVSSLGCVAPAPAQCVVPVASTPVNAPCFDPVPGVSTNDAIVVRASGKTLELVFHSSQLSNLVYQLDCLATDISCSREAYRALWRGELGGLSKEDEDALTEWRSLKSRYYGAIKPQGATPSSQEMPIPRAGRGVDGALRVAMYGSDSVEQLSVHLGFLVSVTDVSRARAIIERFLPRFTPYWAGVEPSMRQAANGYADAVKKDLGVFVERVSRFYGAELPPHAEITFDLFSRPSHDSATHGQQLGSRSIVEVLRDEKPSDRLDVVLHELFHFFHASSSETNRMTLAHRIVDMDDPNAFAAYSLLDEVLAAALGNGLVGRIMDEAAFEKRLHRPNGLYDDALIDRIAKALLPSLEAHLEAGHSLYDDTFASLYMDAVTKAFPIGLPPRAFLKSWVGVYSPEVKGAYDDLHRMARSGQLASNDELDGHDTKDMLEERPRWTHVYFVAASQQSKLAGLGLDKNELFTIERRVKKGSAFVHVALRKGKGPRIVFFAKDVNEMRALVPRFASIEKLESGILLESSLSSR